MSRLVFLHSFAALALFVSCSNVPSRNTETPEPASPARTSEKAKLDMPVPEQFLLPTPLALDENSNVDATAAREDLALLRRALEEAYVGREFGDKKKFATVLESIASLSRSAAPGLSSREWLEKIDEVLYQIPDNHLVAQLPKSGLSKFRQSQRRVPAVGANICDGKLEPWCWYLKASGAHRVPVLGLRALPAAEDKGWLGFQRAVEKIANGEYGYQLILDLRGNGGGSDVMGAHLVSRLMGREIPSPFAENAKRVSPAALALQANNWRMKAELKKLGNEPVPPYFEPRWREAMKRFELAKGRPIEAMEKHLPAPARGGKGRAFNGKILVLTDAACASSCENIVELFQGFANVSTLGENTAGAVHYADTGLLFLNHSHIMVQVPSDFWRYKDGRFVERVGYPPAIAVGANTDALTAALSYLAQASTNP